MSTRSRSNRQRERNEHHLEEMNDATSSHQRTGQDWTRGAQDPPSGETDLVGHLSPIFATTSSQASTRVAYCRSTRGSRKLPSSSAVLLLTPKWL